MAVEIGKYYKRDSGARSELLLVYDISDNGTVQVIMTSEYNTNKPIRLDSFSSFRDQEVGAHFIETTEEIFFQKVDELLLARAIEMETIETVLGRFRSGGYIE